MEVEILDVHLFNQLFMNTHQVPTMCSRRYYVLGIGRYLRGSRTRDQRVRKSRRQFWDTRPCAQDTPKAQATWAGDNLTQAESQEMNVFGIEAKAEWGKCSVEGN